MEQHEQQQHEQHHHQQHEHHEQHQDHKQHQHHEQQDHGQHQQPVQEQPQQQQQTMNPKTQHADDEWESSLCDCSPCGTCFLSTCLPCILMGRTSSRMKDPTMKSHSAVNGDCTLFCCIQAFTCLGFLHSMIKRGEIREKYGIKGSFFGDFCVSCCCICCAMVQQDKEVKARTARGPIMQQYQGQQGMHMPV